MSEKITKAEAILLFGGVVAAMEQYEVEHLVNFVGEEFNEKFEAAFQKEILNNPQYSKPQPDFVIFGIMKKFIETHVFDSPEQ